MRIVEIRKLRRGLPPAVGARRRGPASPLTAAAAVAPPAQEVSRSRPPHLYHAGAGDEEPCSAGAAATTSGADENSLQSRAAALRDISEGRR